MAPAGIRMVDTSALSSAESRFAEALIERGLLTREGAERIIQASEASGASFTAAATRLGLLTERDLASAFENLLEVEAVDRDRFPAIPLLPVEINVRFLKSRRLVLLGVNDASISVAMGNPLDERAIAGVEFATGKQVVKYVALESEIEDYFADTALRENDEATPDHEALRQSTVGEDDLDRLSDHASEAPVIRLVHRLISRAMDRMASDVHFEPSANALTVRFRIDGMLEEVETLSARWSEAVASRLKLMAKLDIAEKRIPQDGRIRFAARGVSLDLRVATFPTLHGEAVVLRLLGQQTVSLDLESLGLGTRNLIDLKEALNRPHGIILITGPTGSGKTTTLYAALTAILRPELKIVTVEDPIEYSLPGVSQLQVKTDIGLTYASALRSVLRNDPDVIMIGEIRDRETADIAVRSALTGHLVLATLHTNTAAGAVTRLLDLGVESYLLSSTLVLSAAQRLVRRLCPSCASKRPITDEERKLMASALDPQDLPSELPRAVGCKACADRGYAGRIPLFEALPIHGDERALVREFSGEDSLASSARRKGSWSLWRHGVQMILAGKTTLEEVLAVINEDA